MSGKDAWLETVTAAVLGHMVGDALGVPVEFYPREKLAQHPVAGMMGHLAHNVPAGTWSDDSSLMLCTLESLGRTPAPDMGDMMTRFCRWAKEGYMTPHGKAFGIGRTTLKALAKYLRGEPPAACGCRGERDNGNGSLMRILPAALYAKMNEPACPGEEEKIQLITRVSALTHAHPLACMACGIYAFVVWALAEEQTAGAVFTGLKKADAFFAGQPEHKAFERLFAPGFAALPRAEIQSTGYVTDTLEAALWCLLNTTNYKDCVLKAVNLGGDTDTIAALAGALAGLLYGRVSIPPEWTALLAKKETALALCRAFAGG